MRRSVGELEVPNLPSPKKRKEAEAESSSRPLEQCAGCTQPCTCLCTCPFMSVIIPRHMSVHMSIHASIHKSACMSIHISIHKSMHMSVVMLTSFHVSVAMPVVEPRRPRDGHCYRTQSAAASQLRALWPQLAVGDFGSISVKVSMHMCMHMPISISATRLYATVDRLSALLRHHFCATCNCACLHACAWYI